MFVIALYAVVVEVLDAFGVELFVFYEFVEHFDEYSVIGAQHCPQVNVSIGLVNEDGMCRGIHVEQRKRPQQVPFPLAVAVLDAAHQFGEMVAIDAVMLEHAIYEHHLSQSAFLKVLKRAVQMHEAIFDLLGDCEHGVDIQRQRAQLFVHFIDS